MNSINYVLLCSQQSHAKLIPGDVDTLATDPVISFDIANRQKKLFNKAHWCVMNNQHQSVDVLDVETNGNTVFITLDENSCEDEQLTLCIKLEDDTAEIEELESLTKHLEYVLGDESISSVTFMQSVYIGFDRVKTECEEIMMETNELRNEAKANMPSDEALLNAMESQANDGDVEPLNEDDTVAFLADAQAFEDYPFADIAAEDPYEASFIEAAIAADESDMLVTTNQLIADAEAIQKNTQTPCETTKNDNAFIDALVA